MTSTPKHQVNPLNLEQVFTFAILFSIIFLPDLKLTSSFAARPEDPVILLAFCYLCLTRKFFNTSFTRMLILMAIIMFASIGLNARLGSINSFEFYNKIIKGSVCYGITLLYMQQISNYIFFRKILNIYIIVVVIINIMQIFHIPVISNIYDIYSNQIQIDAFDKVSATSSLPRITGLIGNPNNNATFFLIIIGFVLDQMFLAKRKSGYLLVIMLCISVILLTQSRTMFATTIGLFMIVLCLTGNILIVFFAGIVYFIIQILDIKYLSLIFNHDELAQTNSYTGRIAEWQVLFEKIKQQPIIGYGGYKEYFYETQSYPENEYILGWFRYGVFYVIAYIYLFVQMFIRGFSNLWLKLPNGYFMLSTSLAMIIGSISNTPFNNPRLFVLFSLANAYFQAGILHIENISQESQDEADLS